MLLAENAKRFFRNTTTIVTNRFVIFAVFLILFVAIHRIFFGCFLPTTDTKDLWFYSGLFMIVFSLLFIEPYYTSPKNVITNSIPLFLMLLAIRTSFNNQIIWLMGISFLSIILAGSIIAIALEDKNKSISNSRNRIAETLKNIVVILGQGKVLYSAVFIYFLVSYYSIQNFYTVTQFGIWCAVVLVNPKHIHNNFTLLEKRQTTDEIGEIFGVQSKKVFLAKLYEDRRSIKKFDIVKFKYSMQEADNLIITGIVFDTYLLNQEKWAKILQLANPERTDNKLGKNIVYKLTDRDEIDEAAKQLKVETFVGVIIDGSDISKINFEYSKKNDDLQEGDLLELKVGGRRLFYQVINGVTAKEKLEAQNETGFIEGAAVQLGEWQEDKMSFQKFGWVPSINTPIYKADTSDIKVDTFSYPLYKLGIIPGTSLPSILNLSDAVSHHTALLGVTGAGKSFICREIIKELQRDTKIICVDLTGEWKEKLAGLNPTELIKPEGVKFVEAKIAEKNQEYSKYYKSIGYNRGRIAKKSLRVFC